MYVHACVCAMCLCVCVYVHVYMCIIYRITFPQEGVVKMQWCHSAPLLYTACLDGMVRLWDARNASAVRTWEGHTNHLLDMDITRFVETVSTIHLCSVVCVVHIQE